VIILDPVSNEFTSHEKVKTILKKRGKWKLKCDSITAESEL
jgi:hypothetical protein